MRLSYNENAFHITINCAFNYDIICEYWNIVRHRTKYSHNTEFYNIEILHKNSY